MTFAHFLLLATLVPLVMIARAAAAPQILHLTLKQHLARGWPTGTVTGAPPPPPHEPPFAETWSIIGLGVGTPAQPLELMVDSGSAPFAVYLTSCDRAGCKHASGPKFDPLRSSTYKQSAGPPRLDPYGAATFLVQTASDVLNISSARVALADFSFDGVENITLRPGVSAGVWEKLVPSGIAGQLHGSDTALVRQLHRAGVIPSQVHGFVFGSTPRQRLGSLTLGGLDPRLFVPPIVWWNNSLAPVITNVTIDGEPTPVPVSPYPTIDSGAALFSAEVGLRWTIGSDCRGFERLPTIRFLLIGQLEVKITPEQYVFRSDNGTTCSSGLSQLTTLPGGSFSVRRDVSSNGVWTLAGRSFSVLYSALDVNDVTGTTFGWAIARG